MNTNSMLFFALKLALMIFIFYYARIINQEKYVASNFTKVTNWLIYFVACCVLGYIAIFMEGGLVNIIFIGLIILQSIMILINTYQTLKAAEIIQKLIWAIIILSLLLNFIL